MKSLLLVHGAGSSPSVFDHWSESFPNLRVEAVDLQRGLDPSRASMSDYALNVTRIARELESPLGLVGWSMGGLVSMMVAGHLALAALILLEPSAPGEIQGFDREAPLRNGTFDPQEIYGGRFPPGWGARPESLLARDERKRGIAIPSLPPRTVIVYGRNFPDERGRAIASFYGIEERSFPDLDHGDLVDRVEVRETIARFLERAEER